MSLLYAYFDESGIHRGARCCVLAGYVGSVRQHQLFDAEWRKTLGKFGLADFHAKEFFAAPNEPNTSYACIRDRMGLLDSLAEVINSHRITPVGATVDIRCFQRLPESERRFWTGGVVRKGWRRWYRSGAPSKPYFLAFQSCIKDAIGLAKPGKRVQFVFDRQDEYSPLALQTFNDMSALLPAEEAEKMGGCVFECRDKTPPLQAADLLAHCWYSFGEKEEDLEGERQFAIRRLAAKMNGIRLFNDAAFEEMRGKLSENMRMFLRGGSVG